MKITDFVAFKIDKFPMGYVFTYIDIIDDVSQKETVIKSLNRMVASGKISKLSKGKFYKPENTAFGKLYPNQAQVVKDLLIDNGKVVGYLTGYSIYNQLGLSTQVSNTIQIGKNLVRPSFKRDSYTISFVKQKNTITKDNIPILQLLDSIRYIKKIPDSSIESSCKRFLSLIKILSENEINSLVRLALKYPPSTRALLGSILEQLQYNYLTESLFKSLNPITKYKINGADKAISTTKNWNIV